MHFYVMMPLDLNQYQEETIVAAGAEETLTLEAYPSLVVVKVRKS